MSWIEKAKAEAAKAALNEIKDKTVIGLGSGSTLATIFTHLGREIREGRLDIQVVPASSQSEMLCTEHRIPITTLNQNPR
ncbi:MAG: ribose 5-phosphate isomerase A, partial [Candidatus Bathyarchaeia archaeon]